MILNWPSGLTPTPGRYYSIWDWDVSKTKKYFTLQVEDGILSYRYDSWGANSKWERFRKAINWGDVTPVGFKHYLKLI